MMQGAKSIYGRCTCELCFGSGLIYAKLCGTANLAPSSRPYTRMSWVCSVTQVRSVHDLACLIKLLTASESDGTTADVLLGMTDLWATFTRPLNVSDSTSENQGRISYAGTYVPMFVHKLG